MATPIYLWFDAEFTSLELDKAQLLQVAMLATDVKLNRLAAPDTDINLHVRLPEEISVSPWVQENIPEIIAASRAPNALPIEEVDDCLMGYIDRLVGPPHQDISNRPILAGNSIHNDWFIAKRFLPEFISRLHYRLLDVSTLKILFHDWSMIKEADKENPDFIKKYFPGAHLSEKEKTHNAYFDIQASIAELNYYRSIFPNKL